MTSSRKREAQHGPRSGGAVYGWMRNISLFAGAGLSLTASLGQTPVRTVDEVDRKVEVLLRRMTLEEKIGQLSQLDYHEHGSDERVRRGEVGAYLNLTEPEEINRVQRLAIEGSRLHIPMLMGFDVINGYRTLFPISLAQAATWDTALVERMHETIAGETAAVGLNWTFAPMVDIARDPRWGRIVEGSGEDPWLGSAMAAAKVRGLQGPALGTPGRILACVKHFAGYGAPPGGRDYDSVYLPEEQMENVYLPPFHAAVGAGVGSVMSAYMDLNDVPASGNVPLLRGVLRRNWGFSGFVVSDSWAIHSMHNHGFARDVDDAGVRALRAGVNMDMGSDTYFKFLVGDVRRGEVTRAQVDDAVRPVLRIKYRLGLFDHPYVDAAKTEAVLTDPGHRTQARLAAAEAAVLLCNEGGLLPIARSVRSIAVIGELADDARTQMGSWPGNAREKETVSVLEGIRRRAGAGVRVSFAPGAAVKREYQAALNPDTIEGRDAEGDAMIERAVAASRAAELTILVLGESAWMNGEASSRASIELSGRQEELMRAVVATGKPVVLVLVNGRPLNITWASTHVAAILEAWQGGSEGGDAVADLLWGDAVPGGKLPITWPRSTGQIPIWYAHNHTQLDQEAKSFKSFYWDEPTTPLYPFGYGLSYTKFAITELALSAPVVTVGGKLVVTARVTNTGDLQADEVVQLYLHQRYGSASRPLRELKGFERVRLAPSESKTVRFTVGPDAMRYWSGAFRGWVVEPAAYDVWVGDSSAATLHGEFTVAARHRP